jgi:hypothetical protein
MMGSLGQTCFLGH